LLNDRIRGIQEAHLGNIFVSSLGGINKFDGERFSTLTVVESNEWKLNPNDLWFSVLGRKDETGLYRYDGKTLHHLKFPKNDMEDEYNILNGKKYGAHMNLTQFTKTAKEIFGSAPPILDFVATTEKR
jgi:hypothetical protein